MKNNPFRFSIRSDGILNSCGNPINGIEGEQIVAAANRTLVHCDCQQFKDAQQPGTDNECYGRLARQIDGGWHIGNSDLGAIKFCPWCGSLIPKITP